MASLRGGGGYLEIDLQEKLWAWGGIKIVSLVFQTLHKHSHDMGTVQPTLWNKHDYSKPHRNCRSYPWRMRHFEKPAPYILTLEGQRHRLICFLDDSTGASLTLNTSMLRGKYSQPAVFTTIRQQVGELFGLLTPTSCWLISLIQPSITPSSTSAAQSQHDSNYTSVSTVQ